MDRLTKRLANGNVTFCGNGTPTQNAMMLPKIMKRLAEYEDAEDQGRLVRLPCKVGDTVFLIIHGYAEETRVRTFFIGHPSYNRGEPDPRYEMVRCTNFDIPLKSFGKTIFLTREEAEEALRKEESNERIKKAAHGTQIPRTART